MIYHTQSRRYKYFLVNVAVFDNLFDSDLEESRIEISTSDASTPSRPHRNRLAELWGDDPTYSPNFPSFNLSGANFLQPEIRDVYDVLARLRELTNKHNGGTTLISHNCTVVFCGSLELKTFKLLALYWLPLRTGLHMRNLLHPPPDYDCGCYIGMHPRFITTHSDPGDAWSF